VPSGRHHPPTASNVGKGRARSALVTGSRPVLKENKSHPRREGEYRRSSHMRPATSTIDNKHRHRTGFWGKRTRGRILTMTGLQFRDALGEEGLQLRAPSGFTSSGKKVIKKGGCGEKEAAVAGRERIKSLGDHLG